MQFSLLRVSDTLTFKYFYRFLHQNIKKKQNYTKLANLSVFVQKQVEGILEQNISKWNK